MESQQSAKRCKSPVPIKLWTSAKRRLASLGYHLPTEAKWVNPNLSWKEELFSVFKIRFDESIYNVKLYKQNSKTMHNLSDKIEALIREHQITPRNKSHFSVRFTLKDRRKSKKQKNQSKWSLRNFDKYISPTPSPPSSLSSDMDSEVEEEEEETFPPSLTPHYPRSRSGSEEEGEVRDDVVERSNHVANVFQRLQERYSKIDAGGHLGDEPLPSTSTLSNHFQPCFSTLPSPYPSWPTPRIDSFGTGNCMEYLPQSAESGDPVEALFEIGGSAKMDSDSETSTSTPINSPDRLTESPTNLETLDGNDSVSYSSNPIKNSLPTMQCMEEEPEYIRKIRERQNIQQKTQEQLTQARELCAKLEAEKLKLFRENDETTIFYERTNRDLRDKLEAAEQKILAFEEERQRENQGLEKVRLLQQELKNVLVKHYDMAGREKRFSKMQFNVLITGKKYNEARQELSQCKSELEKEKENMSKWMTAMNCLDAGITSPVGFLNFFDEKNTKMGELKDENGTLNETVDSLNGKVNGLELELEKSRRNETGLQSQVDEISQKLKLVTMERDVFKTKKEFNERVLKNIISEAFSAIPPDPKD